MERLLFLAREAFSERLGPLGIIIFLAAASYFLTKRVLIRLVHRFSERSRNQIDDLLSRHRVFDVLAYIIPLVVIHYAAPLLPSGEALLKRLVSVFLAVVLALLADRLLSVGLEIYDRYPISKKRPLKGYVQVAKLLIYAAAIIVAICQLLEKSPWGLLSGLGALSAVLLLVFRHTLLSFVASFQVISQDLFRLGDWIEMPQHGADGEVIDMSLHTVKIQNWDKTIVCIPTYRFLEESFKNWRGMELAGGRRIKRAILVDQETICFCDQEMLDRFQRIHLIKDYVEKKRREIEEFNHRHQIDTSASPLNGRKMTNLGTFRIYIEEYLRQHPQIRKDMTLMVRQLAPTPQGLPLEIYCFVADTRWVHYEKIQADIFDHILSAASEFGLSVFQIPTGRDLKDFLREGLPEEGQKRES
ncbi:mechanosensitive ion channel family protein [Thermosulfuriphilus sp.]